jgi:glycosyltransferase involved in cell wall biosynthesis
VKRVLVLNHFAAPPTEPGGTRHVELFSRLEQWDVVILAANRSAMSTRRRSGDASGMYRTVSTTPLSRRSVSRVVNWVSYSVTALLKGATLGRFDVVYGSSPHLLAPLTAWVLARVRRSAFVLEVRDLWPHILAEMGGMSRTSVIYRALTRLEEFLYRRADAIVVMARGVEQELSQRGFGQKVVFIPNGADPSDMAAPAPRTELRQRFGFTARTGVYAGAHGIANGLDLLVDALREAAIDPSVLCVVLVGDGAEKPRLKDLAADLPAGSLRFNDPIPKTEIPALLGAADFGLHVLADVELFRYGVSPNKLFDYMAAGLASLTNTGGEVGELVVQSDAGVSVEARGLADGLRRMAAASDEQLRQWGDNGRSYIESHQSRTAMARRLRELLETVSSRRGR